MTHESSGDPETIAGRVSTDSDQLREELQRVVAPRYQVGDEVGRGGMALVYRGWDTAERRAVAFKVLKREYARAIGPTRFLREIRLLSQLHHPGILPLLHSGHSETLFYFIMPLAGGETLQARLEREPQLPVDVVRAIVSQVAGALDYAHDAGIVHRDIKPSNLFLCGDQVLLADFGIAKDVTHGQDESTTSTGLVIGTVMYMSPEQADSSQEPDRRTDVYALGCVTYQMLAGEPPFSGPSAQAVMARHRTLPAPSARMTRPELPAGVDAVVRKAMAKSPADRYQRASDFAEALSDPTKLATAAREQEAREHPARRWRIGAAISAVALAGVLIATAFHRRAASALDTSLYMVMPFRHRAQSAPILLNGDQCESLLHDALARWRGVQMVDPLWLTDARMRRGGATTVQSGLAIARERRAGRVVLGEVWQFEDTVYVRGLLYDPAGSSRLLRSHVVRIAPNLNDAQRRFQELADSLLISGGVAIGPPPRPGGQLSLPAWRAFQQAYAAIQQWELDSARGRLQEALKSDPTYGPAQLWMAQVLAWAGEDEGSWKRYAVGALASDDSLAPRDRLVAEGLLALAERHYPEACDRYRELIARDSLDFAGWFGLGDCQGNDPLVLRDPTSPSGWRFRGSYHGAIAAYRRALEILPSVHLAFRGEAFARLPELLYTESNHIRQGFALVHDTVRFGAFPSMERDTLEFIPRPIAQVVGAEPGAIPASVKAAVAHNREVLREIATTWVKAFPNRADAHETLALVLETLGELTAGRSKEYSAVSEIRRARATASGSAQALRLANMETRFLVKSEQMAAARALADSLLRANPRPSMDDARQLRGLAALTGHLHLAAQLQRRAAPDYTFLTPAWEEVTVPFQLTDAALGLYAYSAFGVPADSIVALEQRVERLIPSYVAPGMREQARQAMLVMPAVLAFPERGARPVHRGKAGENYRLQMQSELARGDTAQLRAHFKKLETVRRGLRPGDVAFDATYHESWLLLAIGDTAQATHLLDLTLDALPTIRSDLIDQLPQVATFVRGMALRAELADRAKDSATAKRWARNVLLLWAGADLELQPMVRTMREIL